MIGEETLISYIRSEDIDGINEALTNKDQLTYAVYFAALDTPGKNHDYAPLIALLSKEGLLESENREQLVGKDYSTSPFTRIIAWMTEAYLVKTGPSAYRSNATKDEQLKRIDSLIKAANLMMDHGDDITFRPQPNNNSDQHIIWIQEICKAYDRLNDCIIATNNTDSNKNLNTQLKKKFLELFRRLLKATPEEVINSTDTPNGTPLIFEMVRSEDLLLIAANDPRVNLKQKVTINKERMTLIQYIEDTYQYDSTKDQKKKLKRMADEKHLLTKEIDNFVRTLLSKSGTFHRQSDFSKAAAKALLPLKTLAEKFTILEQACKDYPGDEAKGFSESSLRENCMMVLGDSPNPLEQTEVDQLAEKLGSLAPDTVSPETAEAIRALNQNLSLARAASLT